MRSRDEDIVRVADVGVRRERCLKSALSRGGKLMQFFFSAKVSEREFLPFHSLCSTEKIDDAGDLFFDGAAAAAASSRRRRSDSNSSAVDPAGTRASAAACLGLAASPPLCARRRREERKEERRRQRRRKRQHHFLDLHLFVRLRARLCLLTQARRAPRAGRGRPLPREGPRGQR